MAERRGAEEQVRGERECHSGVHAPRADDLSTSRKRAHGTTEHGRGTGSKFRKYRAKPIGPQANISDDRIRSSVIWKEDCMVFPSPRPYNHADSMTSSGTSRQRVVFH